MKKTTINWNMTLIPLVLIGIISVLFMLYPQQSGFILELLRSFFVEDLGFFYILLGIGMLITAGCIAFSKYGHIRLGDIKQPRYSTFSWGSMIFTSTMAADILYWSLCEWSYYYNANMLGMGELSLAQKQDFASAYPLFHWGPIPWVFYILPACAYAYMLFVKKRNHQTLSEALRPWLKEHSDDWIGKVIDIFAIIGLLAGTATTFSLATPLLSNALATVFGFEASNLTSIFVLVVIGTVFMVAVIKGMKAIAYLANFCVIVFCILVGFFVLFGPKVYLIETGITGIGVMLQNFISMCTWMDPLRVSGFPQDWTIFYWAYWIAWFVATPFFIAKISEGRTVKETILGGLACGIAGTFTSFIIFGGYGLYLQTHGILDVAGMLEAGMDVSVVIIMIFETLPFHQVALVILVIAMIAFYASTFDAITLVIAAYSEKEATDEPRKSLRAFWSFVFLLLPVALLFSESTLAHLQTISIIAAFPLGLIMIGVVSGFIKQLKEDHR